MAEFVQWELDFLHSIQNFATPVWNFFWTFVTMLGESGVFWILLSVLLLFFKKTRKIGISMAISLLLGLIVCNGVLKNWIARPRPYDLDPTLEHGLFWGKMTLDYSFPSGHTAASFEGAVSVFLRNRKWGIGLIFLALLIGISRICLRVHYPSDVLCGALLGTLLAICGARIWNQIAKKLPNRKKLLSLERK